MNLILNPFDLIVAAGSVCFLFTALIIWRPIKHFPRAIELRPLASFILIFLSFNYAMGFFARSGLTETFALAIILTGAIYQVIYALLVLLTLFLIKSDQLDDHLPLKHWHLLLFIPFFLNLYSLWPYLSMPNSQVAKWYYMGWFNHPEIEGTFRLKVITTASTVYLYTLSFLLPMIFAVVMSIHTLVTKRLVLTRSHKQLLVFYAIICFIWPTSYFSVNVLGLTRFTSSHTGALFSFILLAFLLYFSRRSQSLNRQNQTSNTNNQPKYGSNALEQDMLNMVFKEVKQHFDNEKCYLDSQLSLISLAKQLGINSNLLSQVINQAANCSFSQFVNGYRVKEACKLLQDKSESISKIVGLCGFSSKSSFNSAFKQDTGLTPSQYREKFGPKVESE